MADRDPWIKFYPKDYLSDLELATCSAAAQGVYMRLLCLMHVSTEYGFLLVSCDSPATGTLSKLLQLRTPTCSHAVTELLQKGVLKIDDRGVLYSKRMLSDKAKREVMRERGKLGGNPALVNPKDKPEQMEIQKENKNKKESDVGPSDTPLFAEGSDPYDLASFLRDCILTNDEKSKVPDLHSATFQKWCLAIDRLIRLDNREPEVVAAIIHWCQDDSFWAANIQSADKLRKQFSRLYLQAKEAGASLRFVKE